MKRKKWSESEEQTLITSYSDLLSSGSLSKLRTREHKFQPVADRVNAAHHLRDSHRFPFLWSWRDVSVKITNMRHQFAGVKQKLLLLSHSSPFNWDDGLHLWPNFLRYKAVFGDVDLADPDPDPDPHEEVEPDLRLRESKLGLGFRSRHDRRGRLGLLGRRLMELEEMSMSREENRRDREEEEEKRRTAKDRRNSVAAAEEEERRERLRRMREERREEEEMEWRERTVVMQMEHEKQAMQMQAEACQAQLQLLGVLIRLICQINGLGGLTNQSMHHLQPTEDQQRSPASLGDDDGKNEPHSNNGYL